MVTKKIIVGSAAVGLSIVSLLLYLSTIPGVTIAVSGDITCAGTVADPCVSYFNISSANFTLKFYNSTSKLSFSPQIRNYTVYRFVNSRWREVAFPINMTKGVLYRFKIVAYKVNQSDTVKWGVSSGDAEADPYWLGTGKTTDTYTPSSETHCTNGVCQLTLYSGNMFYSNGTSYVPINTTWIPYNQNGYDYVMNRSDYVLYAKVNSNYGDGIKYCVNSSGTQQCLIYQSSDYSFRDIYGSQDYISSITNVQGNLLGNGISYNGTYPNTTLTFQTFNEMLKENYILNSKPRIPATYLTSPVTLDFGGYIKYGNLNLYVDGVNVTGTNFVTGSRIDFRYNNSLLFYLPKPYAYDSNNSQTNIQYEVKNQGQQIWFYVRTPYLWLNDSSRVYPVYIDPTITLNESNYGNVGDTQINSNSPNTNYGTGTALSIGTISGIFLKTFVLWNLSVIPSGSTITNANMSVYLSFISTSGMNIGVYNTTNNWNEFNLTYNNAPAQSVLQDNITSGLTTTTKYWNITNATIYQYSQNNQNLSVVFVNSTLNTTSTNYTQIRSKEYVTATERPQLNITYTPPPPPPICSLESSDWNSTYPINSNVTCFSADLVCNLYRNDTLDNDHNNTLTTWGVNGYNWTCNATGTTNNMITYITQNTTNIVNIFMINSTNTYKNQNMTANYTGTVEVNVTANYTNSGTTALYRNATIVTNPYSSILSFGMYNFTGNITGNQNYTSNSTGATYWVNITDPYVPFWSLNSTNSTLAGTAVNHSLNWTNGRGLSGYVFGFCNGTYNASTPTNTTLFASSFDTISTTVNITAAGQCGEGWSECKSTEAVMVFRGKADTNPYNVTSTQHLDAADIDTANSSSITKCLDLSAYTSAFVTFWYNHTANSAVNERQVMYANKTGTAFSSTAIWTAETGTSAIAWTYKEVSITSYISAYTCIRYTPELAIGAAEFLRLDDFKIIGTANVNVPTGCSNASAVLTNDTWASFNSYTWSNVTKVVNFTTGANISWQVFANDTSNNWNRTTVFNYTTTSVDTTPPTYSNVGVNDTAPHVLDYVNFSVLWADNVDMSACTFGWNATGVLCDTWANDSAVLLSSSHWCNTTKQIPAACISGITGIGWRTYANDTSNNSASQPQTNSFSASTCVYGGSGDWAVSCTEGCTIGADTNIGTNIMVFTGTGDITINANLAAGGMDIGDGCYITFVDTKGIDLKLP